jgi:hypothetical protein
MAQFTRMLGAPADVKELEYISALHQTCVPDTRANGTVSSLDVQSLLSSRYGLMLSHQECISIVRGLGGGWSPEEMINIHGNESIKGYGTVVHTFLEKRNPVTRSGEVRASDEEGSSSVEDVPQENLSGCYKRDAVKDDLDYPEEYLDLVQILSILLIPVLARAAEELRGGSLTDQEQVDETNGEGRGLESQYRLVYSYSDWKQKRDRARDARKKAVSDSLRPKPRGLIQDVLKIMLKNLALLGNHDSPDIDPILDASLVKEILLASGETEITQDAELMREMVEVACSPSGRLDVEAFANALTFDLDKWQVRNEDSLSTIFYDVFEETRTEVNKRTRISEASDTEHNSPEMGHFNKENSVEHSNIDFVVDMHSSVVCVTIIWFFYLMVTVTYASIFQASVKPSCKDTEDSELFGCMLVAELWNW